MKWGGVFCKKVENGGCYVRKWKMGVFCKKWTFPQRRVHYVQYQYFLFYFSGGVYTPNAPPSAYGPGQRRPLVRYSTPVGQRSIVMSMSLCVRLSVCLPTYLFDHHQICVHVTMVTSACNGVARALCTYGFMGNVTFAQNGLEYRRRERGYTVT